jgi:uncharacterized membrane protein YjjP (DUF1212 family)
MSFHNSPDAGRDKGSPTISDQREITHLCVQTGLYLMQHGAESALVENVTRRIGIAFGARSVEVAIMASAITVTTLCEGKSMTTVRRNEDRGINMHMITEVQRALLDVEAGVLDMAGYRKRLLSLTPIRYPRSVQVVGIGLSCACFGMLAGADLHSSLLIFVASACAMWVRLMIASLHFNPLVNFFAAAFVGTSVAIQGILHQTDLHLEGLAPKVVMASSMLLFVPGFPLINGVSDMVKGYINTGLARLMLALLLAAATCAGIMLSMRVFNVWGWL